MEAITDWLGDYRGEWAALGAAFLWAASTTVYSLLGSRLPPWPLNFLKGIIAVLLLGLTLALRGDREILLPLPTGLLLLSGGLGIGLGDTAYFAALNQLGPRRTLLLETLAPAIAALLARIFLAETLSALAWGGMILTGLGVAWVISERTGEQTGSNPTRGIFWAILAAILQASGAVLSRSVLASSTLSPLWSTMLRLVGGLGLLLPLLLWQSQSLTILLIPRSWRWLGAVFIAAFGGTYLGIWLQQTSLKFAPAGIAQTLLATSPLFILPIAAALGEKISLRAIFGVLVALVGIGLLFLAA